MGQTRPLFRLFSVFFKQAIQFLQQINVKNVMCPSSIQCWDLNPRPLKHESRSITTWPRLPPLLINFNALMLSHLDEGLTCGHAYSITGVVLAQAEDGFEIPLLRIRNPWGNDVEWKGPWGDGTPEWNLLGEASLIPCKSFPKWIWFDVFNG